MRSSHRFVYPGCQRLLYYERTGSASPLYRFPHNTRASGIQGTFCLANWVYTVQQFLFITRFQLGVNATTIFQQNQWHSSNAIIITHNTMISLLTSSCLTIIGCFGSTSLGFGSVLCYSCVLTCVQSLQWKRVSAVETARRLTDSWTNEGEPSVPRSRC